MLETMWTFKTARFEILAEIKPDHDCDSSFDETGETLRKIESGEWVCFATKVSVSLDGREIAADYLGGSIYDDPRKFFHEHRTSSSEYRNTLALQAQKKASCHYFPDMVREAIAQARKELRRSSPFIRSNA